MDNFENEKVKIKNDESEIALYINKCFDDTKGFDETQPFTSSCFACRKLMMIFFISSYDFAYF